jgi:pimeloyl-ACP methyl ester carboxylesterase/DNA-binding CsgD family transcriptional regulator
VTPRIRYCATPAGRVAYTTTGTGPPLLCDSGWITHLRAQLDLLSYGRFVERLAEHFTVIRYDKPGCGLSDRPASPGASSPAGTPGIDLSFDAQVSAALAVADAVGAGRFRLFGASQGAQVAAAVAARHPERVESQVLYGMCANGADLAPAQVRDSIVALVRAHGGLGWKALAGAFVDSPTDEDIAALARFQQATASSEVAAALLEVYYGTDIRSLLPAIATPTAVLHREADRGTRFELGREAAALIPGATLIPLPGSSHLFYHGDWPSVLDAALGFLRETADQEQRTQLTARELEVAGLVAEGLTNQAIASRLSVAPRTAEAHMENIRRKLQVRSRAQIAAWVTELSLARDGLSRAPDGKTRHRIGRPAQRYLPGRRLSPRTGGTRPPSPPAVPPEGPPSADGGAAR